jgi:hypothetical protein
MVSRPRPETEYPYGFRDFFNPFVLVLRYDPETGHARCCAITYSVVLSQFFYEVTCFSELVEE